MAGYSGTPLIRKLGIKEGMRVLLVNTPENFRALLDPLPPAIDVIKVAKGKLDYIHIFCKDRYEYTTLLSKYQKHLHDSGMLWVSWPKKASGHATDLDENVIRELAIAKGLVDVKVCAVDETWSALKLVVPVALRTRPSGGTR